MFACQGVPSPVQGMVIGGQAQVQGVLGSLQSCKSDMGLSPNRLKLDKQKKKISSLLKFAYR